MEKNQVTCKTCGIEFTISVEEQKHFSQLGFSLPTHCKECRQKRKADRKAQEQLQQKQRNAATENGRKKSEQEKLDAILRNPKLPATDRSNIAGSANTLYIIGNGFDIMHGSKSSYYAFRDSIGKRSSLREALEVWNFDEDIWANFEESLAHMNDSAMLDNAPNMMDIYGVLDEDDDDFSAADFFAAAEFAVQPLTDIVYELPRRFRMWVKMLKPNQGFFTGADELPLKNVIHKDSTFLNFNYTEFLEMLYGVERKQIKYIHGMRKIPNSELILGHSYRAQDDYPQEYKSHKFHNQTEYDFYEVASQRVTEYYDATEKKSSEIIKKNHEFFERLNTINQVIVIGHSLSKVDYPYLDEIVKKTNNPHWQICWYSTADYERVVEFTRRYKVTNVETFR